VLELEYEGDDVSMFILLPPFQSPSGVANVLQRLNLTLFQEIIEEDSMIPRLVEVSIPKFSIEQELQLVPVSFKSPEDSHPFYVENI
jgi:serpin B